MFVRCLVGASACVVLLFIFIQVALFDSETTAIDEARPAPAPKQPFALPSRQEKVEVLPPPDRSEADKKSYKVIRLENGLRALLISDPSSTQELDDDESATESSESETDTDLSEDSTLSNASISSDGPPHKSADLDEEKNAACSLTVGVGSLSNPREIQGLAHFVEHMVFMGSEKYPKENDFDVYVKKKGGSDNAQTDYEATSYMVDVPDKYLLQTLDRFSQFFVKPLMRKESMQREREAIESEFSLSTPSNENRLEQLMASLFPPQHPSHTFSWGNLLSLRDMVPDDDQLHAAAHAFRERHYSAHRITVAVQARLSLPTLQQYVVDTFGQIPTNKLPPDDFSEHHYTPELATPQFRSAYYVKPVGDITEVHLTWIMPPLVSEYQSKPDDYISHLIGHEGKGSLLSYLKKRVWALGINSGNSGSGMEFTSMYSLFSIQILLTQDGLDNIDSVVEAVFSYVNLMRELGPSERVFEEMKSIEEMNFRFEDESQPADYVLRLSENMQVFPEQHFITGDQLYLKYDPHLIYKLMNLLTPESANIMVLSNKHKSAVDYDQKEQWFGTEYKKMEIPPSWLKRWTEVKPLDDFHLPFNNQYITSNFSLISPPKEYSEIAEKLDVDLFHTSAKELNRMESTEDIHVILKEAEYEADVKNFRLDQPNLLRKNSLMEVWYKPDFKFRMPTALLYFYFITPLSLKSAKDSCLLELWSDVMRQSLREPLYPAELASLAYELYPGDRGLQLKISGYNQNLHLLVDVVTAEMRACCDSLTDAMFEAVKDLRRRSMRNGLLKPSKLSKDLRMDILLTPYLSQRSKTDEIDSITIADLKHFSKKLLKSFYMHVLVEGNLQWYDALKISDKVYENLQYEKLAEAVPKILVRTLPLGVHTLRVASLHLDNANSMVVNYYQSGLTNDRDAAIIEILMMLMEEPLFDRLRTKETLGYSVFNMLRYTFGVLGYSVTVNTQADKFSASHVDGRIEAFIKKFSRDVSRLSEKAFNATKMALLQLKHSADLELSDEADRFWREIVSEEYVFGRHFVEARAIEQVTLSDVRSWFAQHTLVGNKSNLRKLSIQVVGHTAKDSNSSANNADSASHHLHYLGAGDSIRGDEQEYSQSFIKNIDEFKNTLKVYPPLKTKTF